MQRQTSADIQGLKKKLWGLCSSHASSRDQGVQNQREVKEFPKKFQGKSYATNLEINVTVRNRRLGDSRKAIFKKK